MSRKKKHNNRCDTNDIYWQSNYYNQRMYYIWKQFLLNLVMNRFKWLNLPKTCDERFLEATLLFEGVATIAFPKKQKGIFYSTSVQTEGAPNLYENPIKWYSVGTNDGKQWRFKCNNNNGVVIYDNSIRQPTFPAIDIFARELTDIMRTKQINRLHQKVPFVLKGKKTQENDMLNIYKQIAGNEPAMILDDSFGELIQADKIDTQVPFMGAELQADFLNTLSMAYMYFGIPNLPFKSERQIEDEVNNLGAATEISLMSPLGCRRREAEKLNTRFPKYLDAPVQVVWNADNLSESWNFIHNILDQAKYGTELGNLIDARSGDNDD